MREYSIPAPDYAAPGAKNAPYPMENIMKKLPLSLGALLGAFLSTALLAAPPPAPVGLCLQSSDGTQCISTNESSSGSSNNVLKWHPGHYVGLSAGTTKPGKTFSMTMAMKDPVFVGIKMIAYWSDLETGKGVYNFSTIENALKEAQNNAKGLIVEIRDRSFSACEKGMPIPSYLLTSEYNGGVAGDSDNCIAQVWNSKVIDREIAFYQALAARFDSERYFYGIRTEESALGLSTTDKLTYGWTDSTHHAEMMRLNIAIEKAFSKTPYFGGYNWGSYAQQLLDQAAQYGYGIAWPDTIPGKITDMQEVIKSQKGKVGVWAETQSPRAIDFSVEEVYNAGVNIYGATHMIWKEADYSLIDPSSYLSGYVIPILKSGHPTVTTCPLNLNSTCSSTQ